MLNNTPRGVNEWGRNAPGFWQAVAAHPGQKNPARRFSSHERDIPCCNQTSAEAGAVKASISLH